MGEIGDRKIDDLDEADINRMMVKDFTIWAGSAFIIIGNESMVEPTFSMEVTTRDGVERELMFDDEGAKNLLKGLILYSQERIRQQHEEKERDSGV